MPSGVVQAIGKSRSGKPTVTVGGQIYSASKLDLSGLQVGDTIEMDTASSVYNGATVWFLNAYKVTQAALPAPPAKYHDPQHAAPSASQLSPRGSVEHERRGLTDAERILAYGVVTEAIKATLIKEPEQIEKWVCAAKNALRSQGE